MSQNRTGHDSHRIYASGDLLKHCHSIVPGLSSAYGYKPTLAAGIVLCILFGLSLIAHLIRSIQYKRWTSFCLSVGALVEFIGWAGRTWSAKCPYNKSAFLIQISTLVIAPVFFAAAIYLVLARLIVRRGPQYSLLKPKLYLWIFCSADFLSLMVQAAGGGIASGESNQNKSTKPGTHIIVAGILIQLFSMTIFSICFGVFLFRSKKLHTPKNERLVIGGTILALVCVYIRSFYRTIELFQGWTGYLISHERFFVALDAAMIVIASISLNILDPAVLLKDNDKVVFEQRSLGGSPGSNTEVEEHQIKTSREK